VGIAFGFLCIGILISLGIASYITIVNDIIYFNEGDRDNCVKEILGESISPVTFYISVTFITISFLINICALIFLIRKSYKIDLAIKGME
jgi:hypothetical protein